MVVDDFNVVGVAMLPDKADPPLIVDAYAVLTRAVALQGFQPVTRRYAQILDAPSPVEVEKFPAGGPFESPEPRDIHIVKQRFRISAAKGTDHAVKL
jgi:hypothetical protein